MHVCFFPDSSHWTVSCIRTITCEKLSALVHCNPDMENGAYHPVVEKCATLEFFTGPVLCWIWKPIHYRSQAFEGPLRPTEMDHSGSLPRGKLKVLNLSEMVFVLSLSSHSFQNSIVARLGENEGPPCRLWWFLYLVLHQKHLESFWNYRFLGPESESQEMQTDNKLFRGSYLASKMRDQCFPPCLSRLSPHSACLCGSPHSTHRWERHTLERQFCSMLIPGWCEIRNPYYLKGCYWSDCLMESRTEEWI